VLAPAPVVPAPVAVGAVRAVPESLTEVAVIVPLEPVVPWTTIESPGCTAVLLTLSLLETMVAEDNVTLTVLPELSVM
jgi:hypothetical protein